MHFSSNNLINVLKVEETLSEATILNTFYFLSDNHTPAGKLIIFMAKVMNHNYQKALWECFYLLFMFLPIFLTGFQCLFFSFIIIFKIYLFVFDRTGSSLLRVRFLWLCWAVAALPRRAQLLLLQSTGSSSRGLRALEHSSIVLVLGLSCSAACRIVPDQGPNPCHPHWEVASQPRDHQGSLGMPLKARFHRSQEYYLSLPALHVLLQHPAGHQVTAVAFYA